MVTKKITLNELRSIVKQIIKEEMTDNTLKIELYATSSGAANPKSRQNVESYRKIQDSLKNNVPVQFTVRYINEKGGVTVNLVNGVVKPVSRGKEDVSGKLRAAAVADIKLFSEYGKKQNYEGQETINDVIGLIDRFSSESANNFIKQNQQPVSESLKLRNYLK